MLRHGLMLHSPAFILLAVTNALILLWSLNAEPPSTARRQAGGDLEDLDAFTSSPLDGGLLHGHVNALEKVRKHEADLSRTQSCETCVLTPESPLCEYGLDNIHLSRAYQGSGHRVRKMLEKALRGEVIKVGIIGGSVSAGHGIRPGEQVWHARWFVSFKKEFPTAELHDGTAPAVGSDFFSWCYKALIDDNLDLYIVEVDINNEGGDKNFADDDALFRGLLGLPHAPAVIRATVVATSFPDLARGFTSDLAMSNYFDVPIISLRGFLLPHFIKHFDTQRLFFDIFPDGKSDYRHMSLLGHQALGDMMTLYISEQLCETRRRLAHSPAMSTGLWPKSDILGSIPRLYLWKPYDRDFVAPSVRPQCSFASSTRAPLTPLTGPEYMSGSWKLKEWNGKVALVADQVGDLVSFPFTGNRIGLFLYHQSGNKKAIGESKPGQMGCWVDTDASNGVVIDLWWASEVSLTIWSLVREGLEDGDHILHCQIVAETSTGGHEIRIMGVASQ